MPMAKPKCYAWRERWRVIDQNVERMPDEGTMGIPPVAWVPSRRGVDGGIETIPGS